MTPAEKFAELLKFDRRNETRIFWGEVLLLVLMLAILITKLWFFRAG